MKNKRVLNLAVASALGLLAPATVQAFGLGKIELQSVLNEPLKAEIPVTALKAGEAGDLAVRLASSSEFEKAGLDRNFIVTDFSFEVVKQSASDVVIKVTSTKAVREPLLDLLLTATTGKGRLIREYTILLDPPKHVFTKPSLPKATQAKPQVIEASEPSFKSTTENVQPVIAPTQQVQPRAAQADQYGVTTNNDTLWHIAKKVIPAGVSMNQMMLALLEENPHAFQNDNINGLKTGQLITIPSLDKINRLTAAEAISAVQLQNQSWKNRNQSKIAAPAVTTTEQASTIESDSSLEQPDMLTEPANDALADDAKLSLVTPVDSDDITNDDAEAQFGNKQLTKLTEQLTLAQETIEAQAQQNIDFQSRMDAMEEQLETMRRIIALKDADLARLQSVLEDEQAQQAGLEEQVINTVEEAVDNVAGLVDQKIEQNGEQQESIPAGEPEAAETNIAEEVEPASQEQTELVSPTVDGVAAAATELLGVDNETAQDLSATAMEFVDKNKLPVSLAGVLLLVVLLLLLRRKSNNEDEQTDDVTEQIIDVAAPVSESEVEESTEVAVTTIASTSEADSPVVEDVSVKTAQDLVEQADVFVGYADYAQARTSLEQARFIEPDDRDIAAKLLFVLYKQGQVASFINVVEDVEFDKTTPQWFDIVQWGRSLAPEHELFSLEADEIYNKQQSEPEAVNDVVIVPESVEDDDELENFTVADTDSETESNTELTDESNEVAELDTGLAFELPPESFETEQPEKVEEMTTDDGLSFDLSDDLENNGETKTVSEIAEEAIDNSGLAFEIDDAQLSIEQERDDAFDVPKIDLPDIDLAVEINEQDSLTVEESATEEITADDLSFELDTESSKGDLDSPMDEVNDELDLEAPLASIDTKDQELKLADELELNDDLSIDESLALELDKAEQELTTDDQLDDSQTNHFAAEEASADLEFDLGGFDDIDEAETKLDLADAYIDMGDPDGARNILEEVLTDGSDEQKTRAQNLLNSIK